MLRAVAGRGQAGLGGDAEHGRCTPDRLAPTACSRRPGVRSPRAAVRARCATCRSSRPHGHVDARVLADDEPFADPAALLVTPDHYVTRLLHASGVPLDELGVGAGPLDERESRGVWRLLCEHWAVFRGTPVRYWLETELAEIFGVDVRPSAATADAVYDRVADVPGGAGLPAARAVRALRHRGAGHHGRPVRRPRRARGAARGPRLVGTRVLPTFRPDRYLEAGRARAGRRSSTRSARPPASTSATTTATSRRSRSGAATSSSTARVSADHGQLDVGTEPLDAPRARPGSTRPRCTATPTAAEATAFRRHMLFEMARMSGDDGLVMTLHPGVRRNHHPPTPRAFGPDTGHDIPVAIEFTRRAAPAAGALRHRPGLPPRAVHRRRDGVLPRDRAAGRLLPVGVRRRAVVVPRRPRRHPPLPRGRHRDGRLHHARPASSTTPARSARSRPGTTCRGGSTPATSPRLVAEHRLDEDEAHDTAPRPRHERAPKRAFKL